MPEIVEGEILAEESHGLVELPAGGCRAVGGAAFCFEHPPVYRFPQLAVYYLQEVISLGDDTD